MELVHDFTVPVPADQAFGLLVDVRRIAPCLPGAVVTSVEGNRFEGGMKVKLGPVSMTFRGDGELVERDPAGRRAVISARGRDAKGNGAAQATVTASLDEQGGDTAVHVVTDLHVTGKAAQFGGGVLKDVSNRLLGQFADNLAQMVRADGGETTVGDAGHRPAAAPSQPFADDQGLDALGLLLGSDAAKNLLRPALAGVIGALLGYLYGKNRVLERTLRRG